MACYTDLITPDKSIPSRLGLYANGLPGVTLSLFDGLTKDEQEDYLEFWEDIYGRAWNNFVNDVQTLLADKFHIDLKLVSRETSEFLSATHDTEVNISSGVDISVGLTRYSQVHLVSADVWLTEKIYPEDIEWADFSPELAFQASGITYGHGLFVAVGQPEDEDGRIATSEDGVSWTSRTPPNTNEYKDVTFGNGRFVAVCSTGTGNRVSYSDDGIEWVAASTPANLSWKRVIYVADLSLFVAVAQSGNNQVMTSPDGETWTQRTTTGSYSWSGLAFGNGIILAVAPNDDSTDGHSMYSSDGITWTVVEDTGFQAEQIAFAKGVFLGVSTAGYAPKYTTDGLSWGGTTYVGTGSALDLGTAIVSTGDYFLILGAVSAISIDGITLTQIDAPSLTSVIGYNDETFVTGSDVGTYTAYAQVDVTVSVYDTNQEGDLLGQFELEDLSVGKNIVPIHTSFDVEDLRVVFTAYRNFKTSKNRYYSQGEVSSNKLSCTFPCAYGEGSVSQVNNGGLNVKFNVICSIEKTICDNINLFKQAFLYAIGVELMIERRLSDRFNRWTTLTSERSEELMTIYHGEYNKHLKSSVKSLSLREDPVCFTCASIVDSSTVLP